MRNTKILIKSFEELEKIFPKEEVEKTFHNLASLFTEDNVRYWIGSGVPIEAMIIEDGDIYDSALGYAFLVDKAVEDKKILLHPDTWTKVQN